MEYREWIMEINAYLCAAEQSSRALHVQHDRSGNKNSLLLRLVSIDSVWLLQSCLLFQLMKEKSV